MLKVILGSCGATILLGSNDRRLFSILRFLLSLPLDFEESSEATCLELGLSTTFLYSALEGVPEVRAWTPSSSTLLGLASPSCWVSTTFVRAGATFLGLDFFLFPVFLENMHLSKLFLLHFL